ncbi:DUF3054 domain-containing protein [Natronolimnobius baerhuensis]|uniref:DUF3054 domain-containing protein n=1 Tax=Natronolimnobius baerhuensis TaxID=253108 RepID=A0A202EBG0_9EURY|nr:DUF3054 domain-containing protein [Natronolimnobius baerhuensis]OVE85596.1 hypothetical protein B2G88_01865 [Natronolimnobius baerhuensis]
MTGAVRTDQTETLTSQTRLRLAAGDFLVLVGLLAVGLYEHRTNPILEPVAALETMFPFLFGWAVAAVLAGVYTRAVATSPWQAARVVAVAWLAAMNVGLLLRSSPLFDGGAAWQFNAVMTGLGLAVLLAWRVGYAALVGAKST